MPDGKEPKDDHEVEIVLDNAIALLSDVLESNNAQRKFPIKCVRFPCDSSTSKYLIISYICSDFIAKNFLGTLFYRILINRSSKRS